ncbi:site-specific integrase [Lachnospiraceae bacterium]|nr:site-specific integrase [Lachnospiraceae bacterium]
MARKGENIYKRKDGRWEGRFIVERKECGKARYQSVYGKTYLETKEKLRVSIISHQEKKSTAQHLPNEETLFTNILLDWLSTLKPYIKESSYNRYFNQIHKNIIPYFKDKYISEIDTASLQQYISTLASDKNHQQKPLSPQTIHDIFSIVRRTFDFAKTKDYEFKCSFQNLYIPCPKNKLTVFSMQEQQLLISRLVNSPLPSDVGILLTLFTGLRIGEICALRWNKININSGSLYVDQSMQRIQNHTKNHEAKTRIIITTPKSLSSIRTIPLPDFILSSLMPIRKPGDAFFLTGVSDKFMEPRTLQYKFEKILSDLNIRKLNFHALRHTFATRCVESGFDAKSLSEILGHASVNVTLNRYVHPSDEIKLQNMNKLENLFDVSKKMNDTVH